jgi:hypothetical protein
MERIVDSDPSEVLKMSQRVIEIAEGHQGMMCYINRRLRIEDAIPIEVLAKSQNLKLINFANQEYPRRLKALELRREREVQKRKSSHSPKTRAVR